ncbi:hypothetical protein CUMW_073140, partial [Citrus unshiu]
MGSSIVYKGNACNDLIPVWLVRFIYLSIIGGVYESGELLQNEFSIFSGEMLIISAELNIGCELYTSKRQFISIDLSKLR